MSGYTCRPGAPPLSRVRSLVVTDNDKPEDLEEANPFSFKEFLKTKNLSLSKDDTSNTRIYPKEASRRSLGSDPGSPTAQAVGFSLDYQQLFLEDLTGAGDLLDEDEDEEDLSAVLLSDTDSRVPPASPSGSPGLDFEARGESLGDRQLRMLQISYEALKDEHSKLRRKLNEVQSFSETQTEMVRTLERKLEAKVIKEESNHQHLESVVQQVEQNLELMTKRAVKAENHVTKLKQEVSLLQAQVSNFKRENEALRSGQGTSLTVVKQNTDVALQNVLMVMNITHTSIKQLVSGEEKLNLVAEILKSIDRISEIKDEEADS
ncbi:Serologically defined colon cancer antigen 3-like protein [Heterocephalus glaber]|uniref:Endosome-associated-trafficking regulator 1 n=1 Tax=Heterocephalus glaber TaxID=10181 RepID=G5AU47_HETGA|nr:Serologically defined colon cancer antigen 3-like protein [Heterocephalus glaber]